MISVSWLYICDLRLFRVSAGLSAVSRLISGNASASVSERRKKSESVLLMAGSVSSIPHQQQILLRLTSSSYPTDCACVCVLWCVCVVCMCVCWHLCVCMHESMCVCVHICMHVCMHVLPFWMCFGSLLCNGLCAHFVFWMCFGSLLCNGLCASFLNVFWFFAL